MNPLVPCLYRPASAGWKTITGIRGDHTQHPEFAIARWAAHNFEERQNHRLCLLRRLSYALQHTGGWAGRIVCQLVGATGNGCRPGKPGAPPPITEVIRDGGTALTRRWQNPSAPCALPSLPMQ